MSATPDQSSFEVPPPSTRVKRPLLVWAILAFYLFSAAAWFVQSGMMLIGPPSGRLDAQAHAYTAFDYFESAGFVGLKLYAACQQRRWCVLWRNEALPGTRLVARHGQP